MLPRGRHAPNAPGYGDSHSLETSDRLVVGSTACQQSGRTSTRPIRWPPHESGRPGRPVLPGRPAGLEEADRAPAGRCDPKASGLTIYIHSPYVLNVATLNNRIRIPSRKLLAQHAEAAAQIGAKGLIVHGGHVSTHRTTRTIGYDNWRKTFARARDEAGFRCRS